MSEIIPPKFEEVNTESSQSLSAHDPHSNEFQSRSLRYAIQLNELFEQLCKINLSAYETRVLLIVVRKTWGWYKEWDQVSLSQFQKLTLLDRGNISRTLIRLIARNIILRKVVDGKRLYAIQRDYTKWAVSLQAKKVVSTDTTISTSYIKRISTSLNIAGGVSTDTPPSVKASEVKEFLEWYHQEYKNHVGMPYMPSGKDPSLVKEMLKAFPMEDLKRLAEKFLNDGSDPFIKKAGYGIAVFKGMLNRLTSTQEKKPRGLGDYSKYR